MVSRYGPTGADSTRAVLADKLSTGTRLTYAEEGIVMLNAADVISASFGPKPSEMSLTPMTLPEHVKGILTNFSL
jgi:hypothetical protein